jgi:hypothetical protein
MIGRLSNMHRSHFLPRCSVFVLTALCSLGMARAQSIVSDDNIPNAPDAALAQQNTDQSGGTQTPQPTSMEGKQTKRILGIIPNFRAVSVDEKLPPQSVKEKFVTATQDSFDYSAFIFVGILAGVGQAQNSYPEFRQGAVGYGRYYWHTLADQTVENYMVEAILPSALGHDTRYYTLGRGGVVKRTGYAFSRVLITRTDAGNETFNSSEIVGAGAAAGISSTYYPSTYQTWTKVGQRWLTNVTLDGMTFVFKEFWPDINNALFHQKQ